MKVRRDISSIPQRTADDTWGVIVNLITNSDSIDIHQLEAAQGVLTSLITDELYVENPLTLVGKSHRLVIYLLHGPDGIEKGDAVDPLTWNPTAEDWTLYVPCDKGNFDWAKKILDKKAPRLHIHDLTEKPGEKSDSEKGAAENEILQINWEAIS